MELIPTFLEGQRVRIHNRPIEWRCSGCNASLAKGGDVVFDTMEVTIILPQSPLRCKFCDKKLTNADGWYLVKSDDGIKGGFPYTLIEAIKEEQE